MYEFMTSQPAEAWHVAPNEHEDHRIPKAMAMSVLKKASYCGPWKWIRAWDYTEAPEPVQCVAKDKQVKWPHEPLIFAVWKLCVCIQIGLL